MDYFKKFRRTSKYTPKTYTERCEKWNKTTIFVEYHREYSWNLAGIEGWNRLFHRKIKGVKS